MSFPSKKLSIIFIFIVYTTLYVAASLNEEQLKTYLRTEYEQKTSELCNKVQVADWNYETDVNNETKNELKVNATVEQAEFEKQQWNEYFRYLNSNDFNDELLKRQVKSLIYLGDAALDNEKLMEMHSQKNIMTNIVSTAKICPYDKQNNCSLNEEGLNESEIVNIMSPSKDFKERIYLWTEWNNQTGKKIRSHFKEYIKLANEAAKANGYNDVGERWRDEFETPNFLENLLEIWNQIKPLYDEIHKYILRTLKKKFENLIQSNETLIPVHLLGNTWGASLENLAEMCCIPYPESDQPDISIQLEEQNYTVKQMFEKADEFYQSLGFNSVAMSYGPKAMITKPDREVVCHATSWDFCNGEDFRIKMCADVTAGDFIFIHHEIGHIEYQIQFKDQPITFRDGANLVYTILYVAASLSEEQLKKYLKTEYEQKASELCNKVQVADWNYETDVNNETKYELKLNATVEQAEFDKQQWNEYFRYLNSNDFNDELLKRQVESLMFLGEAALNNEKLMEMHSQINNMTNIYSTAKICPYNKQNNCSLNEEGLDEYDISTIMSRSKDLKKLTYLWTEWCNQSGKKVRPHFKEYMKLENEAAKANGYDDLGEWWRDEFETPNFLENMLEIWDQIKPLYDEIHKYVLRTLKKKFGSLIQNNETSIPVHLLGNTWGESLESLADMCIPYPESDQLDISIQLEEQNYTVKQMYEKADEFYQSLGFDSVAMSYGSKAMITKPDREVVCHGTSWDFCNGEDFRIKMCTGVTEDDFISVHHEMGHIEYQIQYKDQPITFRDGANSGFHEAIGDTIALSVSTPEHLQKVGLLDEYNDTYESNINFLMKMALAKVTFIPYTLIIDLWRWEVFSGNLTEDKWNTRWWELREQFQKVKAPVPRTEDDFDPGTIYHIAADYSCISYYVGHVLQFMFHKALCIEANQYDPKNVTRRPLHKCDIYKSKNAGDKLKTGLALGSSKHWSEALELLTGEQELSGQALLEYFEPLMKFLRQENNREL